MDTSAPYLQPEFTATLALAEPPGVDLITALVGAHIGYVVVERKQLLVEPNVAACGDPIIVELRADNIGDYCGRTRASLVHLAERAPVMALVDETLLDGLAPLLDLESVSFLVRPCSHEEIIAALMRVRWDACVAESSAGKSEIMWLRDEVEQIAQRLASLAQNGLPARRADVSRHRNFEHAALLRQMIAARQMRARFFASELFADPAWDILLDLARCRCEGRRVSISSVCIAASVPTTTALRWIKGMTDAGLLERVDDPNDGRRSFIDLSDTACAAMNEYIEAIVLRTGEADDD